MDRDSGLGPDEPAILWLHGGPGAPVLPANYASFLPWEKVFTIVHWHQRGAGLTFAAAPPDAPPLTIDRMAQDGLEVAEHVRRRLHKDTIILIGHSWGSVIGTRMVQRRPDLFAVSLREAFEGSRRALFHEQQQVRVERDVPELATPAFLFQGKDDWQVSTPAAVRYFERLRAPSKEVVLFDGGHFVHVFHSDAFLNALTTKVRPLVH